MTCLVKLGCAWGARESVRVAADEDASVTLRKLVRHR